MARQSMSFSTFLAEEIPQKCWRLYLIRFWCLFSALVVVRFVFVLSWKRLIEPFILALLLSAIAYWFEWHEASGKRPATHD